MAGSISDHERRVQIKGHISGELVVRPSSKKMNPPEKLGPEGISTDVAGLLKISSHYFGTQELHKRSNPLFKLLKSLDIHDTGSQGCFATKYYYTLHENPKCIEVLSWETPKLRPCHFEIVLTTVKTAKSLQLQDFQVKSILSINVLTQY